MSDLDTEIAPDLPVAWRKLPEKGAILILRELNCAIDASEYGTISVPPDQHALDFWFGERVFRFVFRPDTPSWVPGQKLSAADILSVLRSVSA
jgi:hypothetical protein